MTYRIPGRVWSFMENIQDTTYDFVLVLRQMYTEQILREKLESIGADYYKGYECVGFQCDENKPPSSHAVAATFKECDTGNSITLQRYSFYHPSTMQEYYYSPSKANTLSVRTAVEASFADMQSFLSKVIAQMISGCALTDLSKPICRSIDPMGM